MHVHPRQTLVSENLLPRPLLPVKSPISKFPPHPRLHQQVYQPVPPGHANRHIQMDFPLILRL